MVHFDRLDKGNSILVQSIGAFVALWIVLFSLALHHLPNCLICLLLHYISPALSQTNTRGNPYNETPMTHLGCFIISLYL